MEGLVIPLPIPVEGTTEGRANEPENFLKTWGKTRNSQTEFNYFDKK